jgi:hypothetical protein
MQINKMFKIEMLSFVYSRFKLFGLCSIARWRIADFKKPLTEDLLLTMGTKSQGQGYKVAFYMRSGQFQTRMEIEIVNMFTCDR